MTNIDALNYLFKLTKGFTFYIDGNDHSKIYLNTAISYFNNIRDIFNESKLDFTHRYNSNIRMERIEIKLEDVQNHKSKIREDKIDSILGSNPHP